MIVFQKSYNVSQKMPQNNPTPNFQRLIRILFFLPGIISIWEKFPLM